LGKDLVCGRRKSAAVRALNAPTTFIPKGLFTFPHPNEVGLVISVKAGLVVIDAVMNLSTWGQVLRWNWVHTITIVLITKALAS
jgi:hypothetical protein